ncbi:hypothetical protein EMCG_02219 [[Emmonsia] crescens]|uniref:Uncharacterized protein n=1 Tax=[Emmonsia] crescens TaxID=73230 RepID=A0A0G2HZG1_9EURO|nr:hypothetical protein EMCG_02219 [Emmonsia crescens UAMH 3008]
MHVKPSPLPLLPHATTIYESGVRSITSGKAPGAYALAQHSQAQSMGSNQLPRPESRHIGTPPRQQIMCAELPSTVRPAGFACCAWRCKDVEHGTDRGLSLKAACP